MTKRNHWRLLTMWCDRLLVGGRIEQTMKRVAMSPSSRDGPRYGDIVVVERHCRPNIVRDDEAGITIGSDS